MQLWVIRHAIAEDVEPGKADAARALTDAGKAKLRQAVRGLRSLGVRLDRIVTSPWQRAAQTAELLGSIASEPPILTDLLTRPPRAELLAQIAEGGATTAVVGHEPWLGELIAWLAYGDAKHGDALVIKKCGAVWLEGTAVPGGMQIRASLPPRVLRALR
jgi:phosphohistidine phosphatase